MALPNRRPAVTERVGLLSSRAGHAPHLNLLGRDGGVAVDQLREHAAEGFDAERQRRHVQQKDVLHASPQNTSLLSTSSMRKKKKKKKRRK